jgi:cysteinyl-tRNA synthetase
VVPFAPSKVIRVHDTLQRKKVELSPREPGKVGVYACGPTTYNFIHLGNARPLVAFDVVVRHLRARGLAVHYIRNITDVDDKIIKRANELGEDFHALTRRFTGIFHEDASALCCVAPDVEPKVTDHMGEILALVEKLIARGVAYASEGDVYFSVGDFAAYGELSHQPLDQLEAGARVDVGEKKRAPLDFALWKAAKPGEPSWDSPWGKGRPGWHIECSAMAEKYLGREFDVHGGGVDLTFPHHENERAQSLGANGAGTFARYWLHNGFVNFNGGKISKSDQSQRVLFDRAFRLRILIERHGGETVRAFLLTTQYRNPINFEVDLDGDDVATAPLRFPGLEEAERRLEYGYLTKQKLADALAVGKPGGEGAVAPEAEGWLARLQEALDDDFNTAEALAALGDALALANRILDGKLDAPKDVKRRTLERLAKDFAIAQRELGLYEADPVAWLAAHRARRCSARKIDPARIDALLVERTDARKAKDFARADALRDQLKSLGIEVMDTPRGPTWRVAD